MRTEILKKYELFTLRLNNVNLAWHISQSIAESWLSLGLTVLVCLDLQNPELPIEDDEPVAVDDVPPPPPPLTNYEKDQNSISRSASTLRTYVMQPVACYFIWSRGLAWGCGAGHRSYSLTFWRPCRRSWGRGRSISPACSSGRCRCARWRSNTSFVLKGRIHQTFSVASYVARNLIDKLLAKIAEIFEIASISWHDDEMVQGAELPDIDQQIPTLNTGQKAKRKQLNLAWKTQKDSQKSIFESRSQLTEKWKISGLTKQPVA